MMANSLRDARTEKQLCALHRDNFSHRGFWLLSDGVTVTIAQQKTGERAKAIVSVPRAVFNHLIDAYQKPQKSAGRKSR